MRAKNQEVSGEQEKKALQVLESFYLNKHSIEYSTSDLSFIECVKTIIPESMAVKGIKSKGGRRWNYDMVLTCELPDTSSKYDLKFEFKTGKNYNKLTKHPQVLSLASNHHSFSSIGDYAITFYRNHLRAFNDLLSVPYEGELPSEEFYMKVIHNTDYKKHPFFKHAYDHETSESQKYVAMTIHEYLTENITKVDPEKIVDHIRNTQLTKYFFLENRETQQWKVERIVPEIFGGPVQSTKTEIGKQVKMANALLIVLEKCVFRCLLRWKNHRGVLYPAWQISFKARK